MEVLKLTRLVLKNSCFLSFFICFFFGLIEDWGFYSSYLVINPRFFYVLFSSSLSALLIAGCFRSKIYWLVAEGIEAISW